MARVPAVLALALLALVPASAGADPPNPCPGDAIAPDRVIEGKFARELQGSYVLLPFDVPAGTTAVRVKYCYDQPETPSALQGRHTLDLGLYEPVDGMRLPGEREFRGWGGSSHPDVTVSAEGFSSEAQYRADPKGHVPGKTTRGFIPGGISAGRWNVELGVAAVIGQADGDATGEVGWRVELDFESDSSFADEPYRAKTYRTRPAGTKPGWYAGDLHVHAEHSSLGDATMRDTFDYAFRPVRDGGAGLDFLTLTDYVTSSAWGEIGRHQGRYPGKLIGRSAEVITYRGHTNNQVSADFVDYRTGPIYARADDGSVALRRGPRPPRKIFAEVRREGGWTQVNHPRIFDDPSTASFCRGCAWTYTDAETDWDRVDAFEVHTGPENTTPNAAQPTPNPFTPNSIAQWDRLRRQGHDITGVTVSDSHHADETPGSFQSPLGQGTTVVYARELSEDGIRRAVQAGRAYAKLFGAGSPNLRLEARSGRRRAIMGDALPVSSALLEARVVGGAKLSEPRELILLRNGKRVTSVPVTERRFTHRFRVSSRGEYRIQVMRGDLVDALTNPIALTR